MNSTSQTLNLGSKHTSMDLLRSLQRAILEHPVAAQSLITALIREGKAFATTPTGKQLEEQLGNSALIADARVTWEAVNTWMLETEGGNVQPSALLDAFFAVSQNPNLEPLLEDLFRGFDPSETKGTATS